MIGAQGREIVDDVAVMFHAHDWGPIDAPVLTAMHTRIDRPPIVVPGGGKEFASFRAEPL